MAETVLYQDSTFKLSMFNYRLAFKFPFRLALNTRTHTDLVFLKLSSAQIVAFGEAALPPYLRETPETVSQFYSQVNWSEVLYENPHQLLRVLDNINAHNNAAKAAIDMVLHDYYSQKSEKSLRDFLKIENSRPIFSTYTIGISDKIEFEQKLNEGKKFKTIKLKLGSRDDKAIVKEFKKKCKKPFCVDINQGYTSLDEAAFMSEFLINEGALFIEQPFKAEWLEEMAWVKQRVNATFIADESVQRFSDLNYIEEAFGGVNIKLMKSAGIYEAQQMIKSLRQKELVVVFGAMAESSLGNTAAAHLASLADWVDLDGPKLSKNDPFIGIEYCDGEILLPKGKTGIGAFLKLNLD